MQAIISPKSILEFYITYLTKVVTMLGGTTKLKFHTRVMSTRADSPGRKSEIWPKFDSEGKICKIQIFMKMVP